MEYPTIAIQALTDRNEFLRVLAEFSGYDWIVFTSANGVRVFFEALGELGKDARVFGGIKLAAIGPRTADCLREAGLRADFVPEVFTGRELARQLLNYTELRNKRILLLRSEIASDELVQGLETGGAAVTALSIYTAVAHQGDEKALMEQMQQGQIQWLTFASPSAVRAFFEQIPPEAVRSYTPQGGLGRSGDLEGVDPVRRAGRCRSDGTHDRRHARRDRKRRKDRITSVAGAALTDDRAKSSFAHPTCGAVA